MNELKHYKAGRSRVKNRARHEANAERTSTKITKGDTVRVMRGDDKGKDGEVLRVDLKKGRVLIKGINIVKKHRKAKRPEDQSGIIEVEAPMAISNVMLLNADGEPTRVKAGTDGDGKKVRVGVKGGAEVPRNR